VIAARHGTLRRRSITLSYTKLANPGTIVLSNKNMLLQAYTQDIINVQTFHNGVWQDARLKDVLYGPDASVHLFTVKAETENGYSTTLNEKEIEK